MAAQADRVHRNLRLTSPYATGRDVAHLQRALNARLKARRKDPIKVDGSYGPGTANAVRDVLWFLGAPSAWLDHGATVEAQSVIRRPNSRDAEWKATATLRARTAASHEHAVAELVAWVRSMDGRHEDGTSNTAAWLDPMERDFGIYAGAWCGVFAGWGLRHIAGVAVPNGMVYTPNILAWARHGLNGFKVLRRPQKGCLVLFKFPGVSQDPVDHVGLYLGGGETGEGNTSPDANGSPNNGGSVAIKKRGSADVVAYVGVKGLHF